MGGGLEEGEIHPPLYKMHFISKFSIDTIQYWCLTFQMNVQRSIRHLSVGQQPFGCLAMARQSWKGSIQPEHNMAAWDWVGFKNFVSEKKGFPFCEPSEKYRSWGLWDKKQPSYEHFFLFSAFGLVFNCQIGWLYSNRSCDIPWYFIIGFGPWSSLSLPIVHLRNFLSYLMSRWPRSWGGPNMPSLANLPTSREQ